MSSTNSFKPDYSVKFSNSNQGRANPNSYAYNPNFSKLQNEVDEVKDVMKNNIEQILKRGENLDDLADKSSNLESTAIQFSVSAKKVKRKMWWQNLKMKIILAIVLLVILGGIALYLGIHFGGGSKSGGDSDTTTAIPPESTTTAKIILKALRNPFIH